MKLLQITLFTVFLFIVSCKMASRELANYYNNTAEMHQQIAIDLMGLSKKYGVETRVRKGVDGGIFLSFYYANNPEPKTILYDSLLNRDNSYTEGASKFIVSVGLIKTINKIRYRTIGADSNHTFFGDVYRAKDVYDGILIIDKRQSIDSVTKLPYKEIAPFTFVSQEALH